MPRTARGASYGGETLFFRQVREGTGAEAPRRPLRRFPGTFTGHPPYSVRKVRDLGMETRKIAVNPYSAGVLGTTNQGKAVGATSCVGGYQLCISCPPLIPTRGVLLDWMWWHLLCAHQFLSAWHERWRFSPPWRRVAC